MSKKILAILLALTFVFSFAACSAKEEPETTAPAIEETEAPAIEETEAPAIDETEAPVEGETAAPVEGETAAPVEGETAAPVEGESSTAAPTGDMDKAAFVAFLNAETAKAAKGTYKYNRNCSYTKNISLDKGESAINSIISAIDENSNLNTVVGGFLGIGTKTGTFPKDEVDANYQLKATALKEADLQNFKAENGTYTFTLANASNPKKNNATPIARFTNDFITHEEIVDGIAGFTTAIKVKNTKINYNNVKVTVKVVDGKIASINYSYNFDAVLDLNAVLNIQGTGAAKTTGAFTEIKY